jgi:aminomethyltransferase
MKRTPLTALFESWNADFLCELGVQLPLRVGGAGQEYEAARTGAILADGGDRAWIRAQGSQVQGFLQRLLTSDVKNLEPGRGQWSAMLDAKGHWVADLLLFRVPDEDDEPVILLDCPSCRVKTVLDCLETFHFGELLTWQEMDLARLLVAGPNAAKVLSDENSFFMKEQAEEAPFDDQERASSLGEAFPLMVDFRIQFLEPGNWIVERPDRGLTCFEFVGSAESIQKVARNLHEKGVEPTGLVVLDILRVENHRPRWGEDFAEANTLPGTGEWHRASFTKGCYTGQEVVAKIDTYGAAPRQLCHLSFGNFDKPLSGSELRTQDNKVVGVVTSWVWSPILDSAIGLGIVKRRALEVGENLLATSGSEEVMITATPSDKVRE